jgi:hypothetical protein
MQADSLTGTSHDSSQISFSLYLWISARLSLFFFFLSLSLSSFWLICCCTILFLSIYVFVLFFSGHSCCIFSSSCVHLLFSFVFIHIDLVDDDHHHYHQYIVGWYRIDQVYWTNEISQFHTSEVVVEHKRTITLLFFFIFNDKREEKKQSTWSKFISFPPFMLN